MAQVINTNIASLNAQRNLNASQNSLATSLERLSSGLRINSAKDDAAGLAISDRFTTQIRGLDQAARNANDAISLSQTAEGALGEVSQNLQRIRELSVQAANATNSASDRAALDLEIQQRIAEIDRVANQTSFNGQKILDGSFGNASFQIGANVGEIISLDLSTSVRESDLGAFAISTGTVDLSTVANEDSSAGSTVTGTVADFDFATVSQTAVSGAYTQAASDNAADAFQLTIDGTLVSDNLVGDADAAQLDTDVAAFIAASNGDYTQTGTVAGGDLQITKTDNTDIVIATSFSDAVGSTGAANGTTSDGTFATAAFVGTTTADASANKSITVDGGSAITLSGADEATNVTQLQAALDLQSAGTYSVSGDGSGVLTIETVATGAGNDAPVIAGTDAATFGTPTTTAGADGATLVVGATDFGITIGTNDEVFVAAGSYTTAQSFVDAVNTALGSDASAELDDNGFLNIYSAEAVAISGTVGTTTVGSPDAAVSGSLASGDVTTVDNANTLIRRVDAALTSISDLRSTFGAIQNRFESVITNLATTSENLSAARSRILDADFAAETANLTRGQILQQAGTAILAQANALPQNVLSLLG